jgi:hypothetical protein
MGLNNIVFENSVDKIPSKILPRLSNFSRVATACDSRLFVSLLVYVGIRGLRVYFGDFYGKKRCTWESYRCIKFGIDID